MTAVFAGQWGPEAVITKAGDALPGASVSLYDADGVTPSTVWTGRTKAATRATPFTPDANGNISFFAEPGAHVLAVTVGVAVTRLPITVPVDPAEDQPLDGDLAAIAALSTTPYGRGFLVQTDAAAARGTLGLGTAATADTAAFDPAGAAATAVQASIPLTQRGAAGGVATLDGGGTIPDGQIPAAIARDTEVAAAVAALVNSAPTTLDTLAEIATALGSDPNLATTLTNAIALKAALAGATFTGDVQVPDAAYDATTWDGSAKVPTRNAVRDALVSLFAAEVTRGNAAYASIDANRGYSRPPRPDLTVVSGTQSGHGMTLSGSPASSSLNDTSDFALGTQSVSWTTTTASQTISAVKAGTVDMTGKGFVVLMKFDNATTNKGELHIICNAGADAWVGQFMAGQAFVEAQQYAKSGEWMEWFIPFGCVSAGPYSTVIASPTRSNMVSYRARHNNNAVASAAKINMLGTYNEPVTAFPNGVVSLSYDDTWDTQYTVARLDLDKYGYKATLFPVLDLIGTTSRLTLAQITALHDYNGWEIGAHSSTAAIHTLGLTGLSTSDRQTELKTVRDWQITNGFADCLSYSYPRGYFDTASILDVQRYYRSARGIFGYTPEVVGTPHPYRLRSINVGGVTLANLKKWVDVAKNSRCWVIFTMHRQITPVTDASNDITPSDHTALIDYIAAQSVPVRTIGEVMSSGITV